MPDNKPTNDSDRKSNLGNTKSSKLHSHRITKRVSTSKSRLAVSGDRDPHPVTARVPRACERCRMKKTKCDGNFPCQRCKADGHMCTTALRRKAAFKEVPKGYAEVLEYNLTALVSTVHRLYEMVEKGQSWTLETPERNSKGQPVVHDIATKLGCLRPQVDSDLPPHTIFPEDEAGAAHLAAELAAQPIATDSDESEQQEVERETHTKVETDAQSASDAHTEDYMSVPELDLSDRESDPSQTYFADYDGHTLSPASLISPYDLEEPSVDVDISPSSPFAAQQRSSFGDQGWDFTVVPQNYVAMAPFGISEKTQETGDLLLSNNSQFPGPTDMSTWWPPVVLTGSDDCMAYS